jgi:hypothetical protein
MKIDELNIEQINKILDSFLKRLCIRLAEKMTEEDVEKFNQLIEEINKEADNIDFSSFKTIGEINDYLTKNISSKFKEFFKDKIPDLNEFILDVWEEHWKEIAKD